MATRLIHETEPSVTSQEAQEVMAYFERLRNQGERMSAQDIAEALSVPVSEVEAVIAQLRGRSHAAQMRPVSRQKNPKKHRGLIFIAVVAWLGILGGAIGTAYNFGQISGQNRLTGYYQYGQTPVQLGNGRVIVNVGSHVERQIPAGVTLSYQGYQVTGTNTGTTNLSEGAIEAALRSIVDKVAGRREYYDGNSASVDRRALNIALATNQIGALESALRFDEFTISKGDQKQVAKLPTALTTDYSAREMIRSEQDRRFAVLANQIARMGKSPKNP